MPPAAVITLMQVAGVSVAILPDLAKAGRKVLPCPACSAFQHQFVLKGVTVDACLSCGQLWLDGGELGKLTRGQWADAPPEAPVVQTPSTEFPLVGLGEHRSPRVMLDVFLANLARFERGEPLAIAALGGMRSSS